MIDAHCHLDNPQIEGIEIGGLEAVITAGSGLASSERAVGIASQNANVYAAVGLGYEPKYKDFKKLGIKMRRMCENKKVVAIGECGLDAGGDNEEELLKFHIELSRETNLPLVVHNRHQDESVLRMINGPAMMHCFTSGLKFMEQCVSRGWYISFGGILTFKKSVELRDVAKQVPSELLLVETDSPYLSPEPVRGQVNSPGNVRIIIEKLAEIRGTGFFEMEKLTTSNAKRLFNI